MISFKDSYSLIDLPAAWRNNWSTKKRYFYWFCAFWLLIAALELGQDYISAILNENHFQLGESLTYKLFWLLFIPFSIILTYSMEEVGTSSSRAINFAFNAFLVPALTLTHLMIFSFFLFGISSLIHEDPWSLPFLVIEKLSTRLYIGLSIYIVVAVLYFLLSRRKPMQQSERQESLKKITVKNGHITILVGTDEIKWISSDGPYLYIHTKDKKHVILDSLKNIITTLPEEFKRIHRSAIVNIKFIKELRSRGNGDYDVIMDDGQILRLSRNYAKPLKGVLL